MSACPEVRKRTPFPSSSARVAVGTVYVGLLVLLGVGMDLTHLERTLSDV